MDVKQYVKTVTERLAYTFAMDEFGITEEAAFWALGAELVSQDESPALQNIVDWVDQICQAPVHMIYQLQDESLSLFRRHVISDNIQRLLNSDDPTWKKMDARQRREFMDRFEEQITYLETHLTQQTHFLKTGASSLSIGPCMHIPLYYNRQFWGIYVVGPYVSLPQVIEPKIQLLSRLLSKLVIPIAESESVADQQAQSLAETLRERISTAGLHSEGMLHLFLPFVCGLADATYGLIVEIVDQDIQVIASHGMHEVTLSQFSGTANKVLLLPSDVHKEVLLHAHFLADHPEMAPCYIASLQGMTKQGYILLGVDGNNLKPDIHAVIQGIVATVEQLIGYRDLTQELTDYLSDTFFTMIRALEAQQDKTRYHTLRLLAFADRFADLFNLDHEERRTLLLTARLHDIGYAGAMDLQVHHTMDEALGHPLLGGIMVDMLPIPSEVTEGIKTHHEWVDGSGTPNGLKGIEMPWTGKIVGLLEFLVEYIEDHYTDQDEDMAITNLLNELIDRTGKQFDLLLIPTIIGMLRDMEWADLRSLGEPVNK